MKPFYKGALKSLEDASLSNPKISMFFWNTPQFILHIHKDTNVHLMLHTCNFWEESTRAVIDFAARWTDLEWLYFSLPQTPKRSEIQGGCVHLLIQSKSSCWPTNNACCQSATLQILLSEKQLWHTAYSGCNYRSRKSWKMRCWEAAITRLSNHWVILYCLLNKSQRFRASPLYYLRL